MKLEVHERLLIPSLLPKEGTYSALKTLRRAREMVSFTPDEVKFYELREDKGQTVWNQQRAREQVKDCPVDEFTTDLIRSKLAEMNAAGMLTDDYLSLYEKFVITYQ